MSYLDEDLIAQAHEEGVPEAHAARMRRIRLVTRVAGLAACLCLFVGLTFSAVLSRWSVDGTPNEDDVQVRTGAVQPSAFSLGPGTKSVGPYLTFSAVRPGVMTAEFTLQETVSPTVHLYVISPESGKSMPASDEWFDVVITDETGKTVTTTALTAGHYTITVDYTRLLAQGYTMDDYAEFSPLGICRMPENN